MAGDLENKVIVVTGGGDGIGRECALAYAREGAAVAILDNNKEAAERTAADLSSSSLGIFADVGDGSSVQAALTTVVKKFGRIDAVHNNAGIASPSKPLHETTEDEWDKLQRTNIKSVYWTTRYAFEALSASKGCILNTASMVGLIGQKDHAAYVATKGAMISLTKAMAADYASHAIRVNAICPAGVWTPMLERWCDEQVDPGSIRNYLDDIHLLGACPHGDVIADAAVFLLSSKARFITGCILPVSGGAELGYRR
ncbi:MAG TPA: SDR family oxidoreductase [Terriglobales bacterium]|jgi:NAD(P)-dependent dehydrogenase (short-subunit alcohol dehydrogenase family)|nr:SDR family oxidoreductase [Terriglobales bacterium]